MSTHEQVAVITRTKNRTLLLERSIRSVLNQTHTEWQHIIVNDGGDPNAVNVLLKKYDEGYRGRAVVLHNMKSEGMERASNIGINTSESKYIAIHDDDDSWEPKFLERCLEGLAQCPIPSVKGVVAHTTQIFERMDHDSIVEIRRQDFDPTLTAISIPQISEINKFLPISFLFERSVFDEIGLYDESLPVIGDWEFNIRYFMKYDVLVIKENLANYHIRINSAKNYENTVTAGNDDHLFHRALIVNKHIRDDLKNGHLTMGDLFSLGDYFYRIGGNTARIGRLIDKLKQLPLVSHLRRLLKQ